MNKQRRKQIYQIVEQLESLKLEIEELGEEERDYYDNMPEGIQDSEKGEIASEAGDRMEYATDNIDEAIDNLSEAKGG